MLLLLIISAFLPVNANAVLNGITIDRSLHPEIVMILPGAGDEALCTGTLVGPGTILTAAHCVNGYTNRDAILINVAGNKSFRSTRGIVSPVYLEMKKRLRHFEHRSENWQEWVLENLYQTKNDFAFVLFDPANYDLQALFPQARYPRIFVSESGLEQPYLDLDVRLAGFGLKSAMEDPGRLKTAMTRVQVVLDGLLVFSGIDHETGANEGNAPTGFDGSIDGGDSGSGIRVGDILFGLAVEGAPGKTMDFYDRTGLRDFLGLRDHHDFDDQSMFTGLEELCFRVNPRGASSIFLRSGDQDPSVGVAASFSTAPSLQFLQAALTSGAKFITTKSFFRDYHQKR